jgi:hypothetical protein
MHAWRVVYFATNVQRQYVLTRSAARAGARTCLVAVAGSGGLWCALRGYFCSLDVKTRLGASLRCRLPTPAFAFEQLEYLFLLGTFSDPLGPTVGRKRKEDDQRDH